ncbi:hypothetical protein FRC08_005253 [Ceratobasidium sp. 394]|nr:hypothetical protein FRC08_005253 [Ceratobasidium sp. 394]
MSNQDFYNNQGPKVRWRLDVPLGVSKFLWLDRTSTTAANNNTVALSNTAVLSSTVVRLSRGTTRLKVLPQGIKEDITRHKGVRHKEVTHNREATIRSPRRTQSMSSRHHKKTVAWLEELAWLAWLVPACVAAQKISVIAFSNG